MVRHHENLRLIACQLDKIPNQLVELTEIIKTVAAGFLLKRCQILRNRGRVKQSPCLMLKPVNAAGLFELNTQALIVDDGHGQRRAGPRRPRPGG